MTPDPAADQRQDSARAEAWDEGYAARQSEDCHSPGEVNPYRRRPRGAVVTPEPVSSEGDCP